MKILFIGCVMSSYAFLEALLKNGAEVVGVITKESSEFNSDFKDITPLCIENGIPYICVKNINEASAIDFIMDKKPDIGYCLGWSQLVKEKVMELFPMGMVGYHPAALPYNRGRHPIIWALALGLKSTASSFFMIEKDADTGDIVSQRPVEITYDDNAETLMNKLLKCGAEQIVELTMDIENNTVERIPQIKSEGNSWRKRGKDDGRIDWRMSSRAIYNLVRALTRPYIGAHFVVRDKEIKVWSVREIECCNGKYDNIEPGKIISVTNDSFIIKTGENLIEVLESEPVELTVGDYL